MQSHIPALEIEVLVLLQQPRPRSKKMQQDNKLGNIGTSTPHSLPIHMYTYILPYNQHHTPLLLLSETPLPPFRSLSDT